MKQRRYHIEFDVDVTFPEDETPNAIAVAGTIKNVLNREALWKACLEGGIVRIEAGTVKAVVHQP